MRLSDFIPRRFAHFGTTNYTFIRWLRRDWFVRPLNCGLREWLGVEQNTEGERP